jgi:hypothetical protein
LSSFSLLFPMLPVYLYCLACLRSLSCSQCCLFTYIVLHDFVLSLTPNVACLPILSCLSSFCLLLPMLPVYLYCLACLRSVSYSQCCLFTCIVHSGLPIRIYFIMFIYYTYRIESHVVVDARCDGHLR